ncbi:MAG: glycosyltransferase [Vicinamibacteria bacterium]|nr:glycosyltransferase [Vicinamibacteria bacterium]
MRILLSTIGSRGDVQPMAGLAVELRELGEEVRLCAPPDFRDWVERLDLPFFPIGSEVRSTAKALPQGAPSRPTPEQIRQMLEGTVATQFETIPKAAEGCDVIVAGNALQIAARSVAERLGIRYVFAAYCPVTLPSSQHAPPAVMAWTPRDPNAGNDALWAEDAERWSERWGPALNRHRAAMGLAPVADVRSHILTDTPWLAADPSLAPWPASDDPGVFQTGAWILHDRRPLPPDLEAFLDDGEPPVYFGFGSVGAPRDFGVIALESARGLKRRAIVSRGWADVAAPLDAADCISIGEVNHQALFPRVAAVVHHGGAGTTTAAARAGTPQVVIPQHYDQPYWAERVHALGIGAAHASGVPTVESLTNALSAALEPQVAASARTLASRMRGDGARIAARSLQFP